MSTALLSITDAGFYYHKNDWVFRHVNLEVQPGEVLTILGKNGAGKSTLLNCVLGLTPLQEGTISLDGNNISLLSPVERARHIAYLRQNETTRYSYTVREFILMGRAPYLNTFQSPRASDQERVSEIIADLKLEELEHHPIDELSGGERQQVTLARALVQDTNIIVMDEPTSALDIDNQVKVLQKITQLREAGYSVIFTTHNPDHVFLLGGRVAVLDATGTVHHGDAAEIMTTATLKNLFEVPLHIEWNQELQRNTCLIGMNLSPTETEQ